MLLALVFSVSAAINVYLVYSIWIDVEDVKPPETGFAQLLEDWRTSGLGSSGNQALLMNVGSVYAGATCKATDVSGNWGITPKRGSARYHGEFALDGRVYVPSSERRSPPGGGGSPLEATRWIAETEDTGAWIIVRLQATYRVTTVEIIQQMEYAQIEAVTLILTDGDTLQQSIQSFNTTQPLNTSVVGTVAHRVILDPVDANRIQINITSFSLSGINNTNIEELRIYGYGGEQEKCCPENFPLYDPELRACFHVSASGEYTETFAQRACHNMAANLVTLKSQSKCVFLLPHISQYKVVSKDSSSDNFWEVCDYPETPASNTSLPVTQVYVCQSSSFCESQPQVRQSQEQ